jgi:hypothetical protein
MLWRIRHLDDDGVISFEDDRVLISDAAIWRKSGHFEVEGRWFFVKEEVAMLKIHPRSLEQSVGHFVLEESRRTLNWKFSGPAAVGGGVSLRQLTPRILHLLRVFPAPWWALLPLWLAPAAVAAVAAAAVAAKIPNGITLLLPAVPTAHLAAASLSRCCCCCVL